jgi:diguanylate cyclase (GGDEF)-like protein
MNLYVCENYFPEVNSICENKNFLDVEVVPFPPMCVDKSKKAETLKLLTESTIGGRESAVLCSRHCEICGMIPSDASIKVFSANYCFGHLASELVIEYVLTKGGYIIGLGWLNKWRERIAEAGFDQATARIFYHDFCHELVFFDAGINAEANMEIAELSAFLDLPYTVIPIELESLGLMIDSVVSERRLHGTKSENNEIIMEMEIQCAEYAAIFDFMGRLAAYSNKRDVIEKVKEIFMIVFGAQKFKYWNNDLDNDSIPEDVRTLLLEQDKDFVIIKDENRFCIKIHWKEKYFGVIDVSGFIFPQYIEKYLNFAIEIVKICGLVFSNNEQYEKILKSEQEQRYSSTHDALTDLYNRTYIKEITNQNSQTIPFMVFMFDIDKLKYVNDNYGHEEGDKLIVNTAAILKKCFRETDIVARIGGDEFIAILYDTNTDSVEIYSNRIRQQVEMYNCTRQDEHLEISFSVGVAVGENQSDTIEAMMNLADERMYADKVQKRR